MRLLIAGGGTGGHLYPGIAVAKAWLQSGPEHSVLFVGTERGIEARVLPKEGLPLETISAAGLFGKSFLQKIKGAVLLIRGIFQSMGIVGRFNPNVVLGVGGYASAPAVVASWLRRRPIVLMEQNAMPGAANRLLSRLADRVAVCLPGAANYFSPEKVVETGLPLRDEIEQGAERVEASWEGPLRVLVFGGSQGAQAINTAVAEALDLLGEQASNFEFVHQTGEDDLERMRGAYERAGVEGEVLPFLYDMAERYRWAHMAVARSGAMTVGEVAAMGLPALLIPLPTATHGHQEMNARQLAEAGAARMILQSD
ncbi:MAG: undecaprenyldiphospho-muramoylpentapeptide beta-N-acetylglucosaminyltransferase, partial [Nitrospinaceae bacterium]|nr:undecaprenyldiphospho-muramoylpentapeptide beta-N-acetylglucosaminyltransferase [Nitrospinaceae bacterium]